MYVTIVNVHVTPSHIKDFIVATKLNHLASIKEPGNQRFDVLQMANDVTHFVLYEAYDTAEAAAAHKKSPHYLQWRELVTDWMATVRTGTVYNGLYPE